MHAVGGYWRIDGPHPVLLGVEMRQMALWIASRLSMSAGKRKLVDLDALQEGINEY